jgi:hypothetical protein
MMMVPKVNPLKVSFNHAQKVRFTFFEPLNKSFARIFWKVLALYDIIVEVVAEILSTNMTSMTIKNPKEANLRPISFPVLILWLKNIKDDTDAVFIVLPYYTLISVGSISLNDTAFLV